MERRRQRAQNFSHAEKELLLSLIEKYRNILDDRRTNGTVRQTKENTWEQIAEEYNRATPAGPREIATLKKWYENYKKRVRSEAQERNYMYSSDIATKLDNVNMEKFTRSTLKNLTAINNNFDNERICNIQVDCELPPNYDEYDKHSDDEEEEDEEETDNSMITEVKEEADEPEVYHETEDSESVPLEPVIDTVSHVNRRRRRRRPKNYNSSVQLTREKIKFIKLHAKILLEDVALRRERERQEHLVRQEILMTELKIKQALLFKIQYQENM